MKNRPSLFSAPMVRAVLDGTKTQTRRICKPQPRHVSGGVPFTDPPDGAHGAPGSAMLKCPYGERGDRLWVREAWREYASLDDTPPRAIAAGSGIQYEAGDSSVHGAEEPHAKGKYRPRPCGNIPDGRLY